MLKTIEKATTLVPSVGADGGQPLHKTTEQSITAEGSQINPRQEDFEEMYRKMQRMMDPKYLYSISMTELFQTTYKSKPPVIENLLYSGVYILAGAPKIGKSFLVAQIAYCISTGQKLWYYEVRPGTVLYLALEDDYRRLQGRLYRMFGVNDTPELFFATSAKQIGSGLDVQLDSFISEHPSTKLIIVDTLQKVREAAGEAYSYASDYEIIGKFKTFVTMKLGAGAVSKTPSPSSQPSQAYNPA